MSNQGDGYRGRPNKECDSCYSFWLGSTLSLLGRELRLDARDGDIREWRNATANREFNLTCQQRCGGFSKQCGKGYPDLLHSYFGVCGLSIIGRDPELLPIDCARGLTLRVSGTSIEAACAGRCVIVCVHGNVAAL
jgi:geranylgeranyl transferase type-1 subunit beta